MSRARPRRRRTSSATDRATRGGPEAGRRGREPQELRRKRRRGEGCGQRRGLRTIADSRLSAGALCVADLAANPATTGTARIASARSSATRSESTPTRRSGRSTRSRTSSRSTILVVSVTRPARTTATTRRPVTITAVIQPAVSVCSASRPSTSHRNGRTCVGTAWASPAEAYNPTVATAARATATGEFSVNSPGEQDHQTG